MTHEPELAIGRDVPALDTAGKRALIDAELRKDAGRSDREIARIVGCDHKTVGSTRERLGIATPLGNSPGAPTLMAGNGGENPPIAPKEPEFDPFGAGCEEMVIAHQPAVAVYENPFGAVVIRQECTTRDDDDPVIIVRPEHVEKLVARLRQVAKEALS
jgi:hypothetical protein